MAEFFGACVVVHFGNTAASPKAHIAKPSHAMKQSYYNVLAPLPEGGTVLYHTYHRSLAVLDETETHQLENIESCTDKAFIQQLASLHFLVEDPEAEADFLRYRQNKYRNNKKVLELTISPTRLCNFSCDYCYILKRPGVMDERVQAKIMDFVAYHYNEAPFGKLKINWYGGEPLLAIDVMESLSANLRAFCAERDVEYFAHVLTNGSLADAEMCRRLVENCGVITIMPTISGNGPMHDYQRCANDGKQHFDDLMRNIGAMRDAGILVHANFVVNHNNIAECQELAAELCHKDHLVTRVTRTFAYGRTEPMLLKDGKNTPIDLFERDTFATCYTEFHRAQRLDAQGWANTMAPTCLYCAAWVNRSFFIDEVGDVFACMIDMDHAEYALCNVCTFQEPNAPFNWKRFLEFASLDPVTDPACRTCRVLPICQGGCAYCRMKGDDVCHDIKDCIEDFVLEYYRASQAGGQDQPACPNPTFKGES